MRRRRGARERVRSVLVLAALAALSSACGRVAAEEGDRIVTELALGAGMTVADVGAGDGEWTVVLSRAVGESGRVWATEVDEDDLEDIRRLVEREGLANVSTVLGTQESLGLEENCCQAILLRRVYHHFTEPAVMRAELRRALTPGGRLAVIDFEPKQSWAELPGVPDRGGHGIAADQLVREMTADGFAVVARDDDWPGDEDNYCVVFVAAEAGSGSSR